MSKYHLKNTPAKGRCLVATAVVQPGELLLVEQPYASVLYDDQLPHRCDHCYGVSSSGKLLRCSLSKLARYCCRDHQRLAWNSGYKEEANALAACKPKVPPPTLRLAARILYKQIREQKQPVLPEGSCFEAVDKLLDHWERLDDVKKALYAQMAVVVREFMLGGGTPDEELPGNKEIGRLLAKLACNSHTICDEELRAVGVGIYPMAAMANHSCAPSCCQSFKGHAIVFRALTQLRPGDEITISYTERAATRRDRRHHLRSMYMFDIDEPQTNTSPATAANHNTGSGTSTSSSVRADTGRDGGAESGSDQGRGSGEHGGGQVPVATIVLQPGGEVVRMFQGDEKGRPPWRCDEADEEGTKMVGRGGQAVGGILAWPESQRPRLEAEADASPVLPTEEFSFAVGDDGDNRTKGQASSSTSGGGASSCRQVSTQDAIAVDCWGQLTAPAGGVEGLSAEATAGMVASALRKVIQAETLCKKQQISAGIRLLQDALAQMDGGGCAAALGPSHMLRMQANSALMKAAIDNGGPWDVALNAARSLLLPYQLFYPEVWPNLGLHWAALAKLEALEPDALPAALSACRKALKVMRVTHPGSNVAREMEQMERELQQETAAMAGKAAMSCES